MSRRMNFVPLEDCECPMCEENIPTVYEFPDLDAEADAGELKIALRGKAVKEGFGCDKEVITKILGNRTANQRYLIGIWFYNIFGGELQKALKVHIETGGDFRRLCVALMHTWPELCARIIRKGLKGSNPSCGRNNSYRKTEDDKTLIDILCTASNCQIKLIREAYKQMRYGFCGDEELLEDDLKEELSGDFANLLVAVCQGARPEDDKVDEARAKEDAQELMEAGRAGTGSLTWSQKLRVRFRKLYPGQVNFGTDESTFTSVLVRNGYAQLLAVEKAYEEISGKTLEEAISSELSDNLLYAARTILGVAKNKAEYFARRLHSTMAGLGTDDKALINIIVLRSEIDLGNIKQAYQKLYGKTLADAIRSDTSGDYMKLLLNLLS